MSRIALPNDWSALFPTRDNTLLSGPKNAPDKEPSSTETSVEHFVRESLSENTRKAYRSDLAHFASWGGTLPSSGEEVARYLAEHAGCLAVASLARRIATLSKAHSANGWRNPCTSEIVRATLHGIKRMRGTAQVQAKPLLRDDLFIILDAMSADRRSVRDRAMLLIGWAGGFRSSELTGLRWSDVEEVREGLIIRLHHSKTDQTGKGRKIGIPHGRTRHCPVTALRTWQETLHVEQGPIFRPVDRYGTIKNTQLRADALSTILRERLNSARINPESYSGHSLRAGLATSAIKAGVPIYKIRSQTGHASDAMLNRYIRDSMIFEDNALSSLL